MAAISVLMPVFNAAAHLPAALEALRAQTFADWNCICVDDGSTDATGTILARAAADEPRLRVVVQPHRGVAAARNALLAAADGEWTFFLDADDRMTPDCLETLLRVAQTQETDLVWAQYERGVETKNAVQASVAPDGAARRLEGETWRRLLARNYSFARPASAGNVFSNVPCQPWNKLIRRSLLAGRQFDESLSRGEDLVFFAEIFRNLDCVAVSSRVTYFYRDSPGTLFRTAGSYAGFHAYVDAVCRFAAQDRPPYLGDYLARRWVLSWLRGAGRWANLRSDAVAKELFAKDCRRLRVAFAGRLPLLSRLALSLAPSLSCSALPFGK